MKQYNVREICKLLKQNGFDLIRSSKHYIYSNGIVKIAVPTHKMNFKLATKILIEAGLK